jgi:Ca2+/Na+ antiporter
VPIALDRALIGAVVWIDLVSGEVVALLLSFGTILDVPTPLLAQTALAWGNSVGDSFANAALARQGETKMAITGCLAAPIFNVLGGFGASLLFEVVAADDGSFDTGLQFDALLGNALAFQGGALLLLLVVGAASQFFLGKGVALALVAIYLTFLTLCFLIGFGVIDA